MSSVTNSTTIRRPIEDMFGVSAWASCFRERNDREAAAEHPLTSRELGNENGLPRPAHREE